MTLAESCDNRLLVVTEVTDTLSVGYTTGIQRVVREIVCGLMLRYSDVIEVVPVVQSSLGQAYRRLTPEEHDRLWSHPAGGRAGRRADSFGRLSPLVRRIGDIPLTIRVRLALRRLRRNPALGRHPELEIDRIPPGAVFLDAEGSWFNPSKRDKLLPELVDEGVFPVGFVHDVMPIVHPEWFAAAHRDLFDTWIMAHLRNDPMMLTTSACCARDIAAVAESIGINVPPLIRVPLGADLGFLGGSSATTGDTDRDWHPMTPVDLPGEIGRFLLVVGTFEPRKNQTVVLDAFERLLPQNPDLGLVLVGKEGWMVDALVERIRTHPELGRRLVWLGGIDDTELAWLYSHAFATVVPSIYEGLGVPVIESLQHGTATVVSTGGALPETAGGAADLFDPNSGTELTQVLARHLDDPSHHAAAEAAARAHRVPTWSDTVDAVAAALLDLPETRVEHG